MGDVNVDLLVPDSKFGWDRDVSKIENFVRADIRFLPFRSGVFDLAYSAHLIEHLENEWEGINELKRVSRKYVIVIVPISLIAFLYDLIWHNIHIAHWIQWQKRNHKHQWNMDPFKTGSFKILNGGLFGTWAPRSDWRRKNKFKVVLARLGAFLPFQTLTLWEVA